jgi:hypothetical protein
VTWGPRARTAERLAGSRCETALTGGLTAVRPLAGVGIVAKDQVLLLNLPILSPDPRERRLQLDRPPDPG